jgi:hypothetical protein
MWHAFFGSPGYLNNLNILDQSPLFDDVIHKLGCPVSFKIHDNTYNYGYYLVDGIYNPWDTLIPTKKSSL